MAVLRAFYTVAFFALGSILPILALALSERGFAPAEYALLMTLQPLLRIVTPPLWGALSDRVLGAARLLRVNSWIAALSMAAFAADGPRLMTLLAVLFWALVSTSIFPLADAGAHALLGERATRFGHVRVFGSLGFMLASVWVGLTGTGASYQLPFVLAAVSYGLAGVFAAGFPAQVALGRFALGSALRAHVARPDVRRLLWGVGAYYAGHGIYDVFFGPHVTQATGVAPETVSLLWAVGVLVEIPLVALGPVWLRRWSGAQLLAFAGCVAVLRWALLSQVTEAWQVWLLQPLHGVTFGIWYLGFVHETQRSAPAGLRATVQGLASAAFGLGMAVGTLSAGQLIERFDTASAFLLASGCAAVASLLFLRLCPGAPSSTD